MQTRFRAFLAAVAAFLAFGLPAAHADFSGFGFSFPAANPGTGVSFPAIDRIEGKLNLTPGQKAQFDVALEASKAAFLAIEASHESLKQFAQTELANTRPNLELLTAELDDAREVGKIERNKARAEWLKLYAMLSDEQVATIKEALQEKMALVSWIRDFVVKWFVARRG